MICDACKTAGKTQQNLSQPYTEHQIEELNRMHSECVGYHNPSYCDCRHRVATTRREPLIA